MSPEERFRRLRDPSRWDGPVPATPALEARTAEGGAPAARRPAWRGTMVTATMVAAVAAVSVATITLRPGSAPPPAGPGGASPSPVPTATASSTPSATGLPTPVKTPSAPPPPSAPTACTPGTLRASFEPLDSAAGSAYGLVTLRNGSPAPCTVGGFATTRFLAGTDRHPVGRAAAHERWTQGGAGSGRVLLAPKLGTAFVLLRISDAGAFDPARCSAVEATALALRLPGTARAVTVPLTSPLQACGGDVPQLHESQVLAKRPAG
jgi:hypothetical protein